MDLMVSTELSHQAPWQLATHKESPDLLGATRDLLLQGLSLLFELNDRQYSERSSRPFRASIGQHYSQVLWHFQRLVLGLRSGEFEYKRGERNTRTETEVTYACIATCDILRALKRLSAAGLWRECRVSDTSSFSSIAKSEIAREMAYCMRNTIGHFTIIKVLCTSAGIKLPPEFGNLPPMPEKDFQSS